MLRTGRKLSCALTVRPHVLRTPYASLNLMADVARTTHPNHLFRANPKTNSGILREFFTCDCPAAKANTKLTPTSRTLRLSALKSGCTKL